MSEPTRDTITVLKATEVVDVDDQSKTAGVTVVVEDCCGGGSDSYKKAAQSSLLVPKKNNNIFDLDSVFLEKLVGKVMQGQQASFRQVVVVDTSEFPFVSARVDTTNYEEKGSPFQDADFSDKFMENWNTKFVDVALTLIQNPKVLNLKLVSFRAAAHHQSYSL